MMLATEFAPAGCIGRCLEPEESQHILPEGREAGVRQDRGLQDSTGLIVVARQVEGAGEVYSRKGSSGVLSHVCGPCNLNDVSRG